ncbi:MAG: hypothetical protein FVQ80_06175 [Planctomycetes bacterium]|nr:hypothetical protein [Planctomycetota bacterium]
MKKNMKTMLRCSALIAVCLAALSQNACAVPTITMSGGDWTIPTIDSTDLQAGAGSDLVATYENTAGAILINSASPSGGTPPNTYRIDVKKVDTTWDATFELSVKRTGDGSGAGSVSGGTTYQQITDTDAQFFTGDLDRIIIPLQFQLAAVSVSISPDSYSTTVTFTIIDI